MKRHDPLGVRIANALQHAHGRYIAVNLGIALIRENLKIIALRQRDQITPIPCVSHSALRVGWRAHVTGHSAVQDLRGHRRIIRQMTGAFSRGHQNRLRPRRNRGQHIDLVKWVRHQNDRLLPILNLRAQRHTRVIQALAGPVQRHNMHVRIHRHRIAARQPITKGCAQLWNTLVRRVIVEPCRVLRNHIRHPCRKGMFRLTNGHVYDITAGRVMIQQGAQTRECISRKVRKPLGKLHKTASGSGSFMPRFDQDTPIPRIASSKTTTEPKARGISAKIIFF
mmetsp:Transcript_28319/g.52768  ORF Transcript_28319/g.52768 Transcript_28319/m.52768 type:complete len:281 (+) Transcript_28319:1878-2720(+)